MPLKSEVWYFLQNEELFESWLTIFNGAGAQFNVRVPIYSFDGRDILTDSKWLDITFPCRFQPYYKGAIEVSHRRRFPPNDPSFPHHTSMIVLISLFLVQGPQTGLGGRI